MSDLGSEFFPDNVEDLRRRLKRERTARLAAEAIAESGLRELYDKKEQLELLRTMAVAATESRCIEDVLRLALTQVCETTGWPLGHAYLVHDSEGKRGLTPTTIWHGAERHAMRAFRETTESMEVGDGVGLPGRVLASGEPACVTNLSEDKNCPRMEVARRANLAAAFAFPVLIRSEVVAVLEFFSHKSTGPDEFFLQLMAEVGTQLGRVVERRRTEDQLIHDALHDPLTKLPNRTLFVNRLTQAISSSKTQKSMGFAILFIDLDRFKIANDSLGHYIGDLLLVEVAARLSACVRNEQSTKANPASTGQTSDVLARLGGDEFTILLDNLNNVSISVQVANRVQEALAVPFQIENHELFVSASVGIAWSLTTYDSPDEVMRDADLAMYRAKARGGGCCEIYDRSMYAEALDRLRTEANLRHGLRHNEFILQYQPIVNLRSSQIIGFEALVRWQQDGSKLIYPDKFIGVAEHTGLIIPLGLWVLREACKTMYKLQGVYPQDPPLTISINISARQFAQADLIEDMRVILLESDIDPGSIRLEITESVTMGNAERTVQVLSDLKAMGLRFSLDDFGTGFSCLSYLRRFPLDVLKIDRSFVSRMEEDNGSLAIVKTIISLAHGLGMQVVAEGTETLAQVSRLRALGCEFAQGYFFAKPLNESDACKLLEAQTVSWLPRADSVLPAQERPKKSRKSSRDPDFLAKVGSLGEHVGEVA